MSDFITYIQDVTKRSDQMRQALIDPFREGDGTLLRPQCRAATKQILKSNIKGTIFENIGDSALMIAGIWVHALQNYERIYKRQPSADLLASAHKAIENMLNLSNSSTAPDIFNGINMSSTVGIQTRDCAISLVLPTYLTMISPNMVTYILGDFYKCDFFRIEQQVDANFSGRKKGDVIYYNYKGVYPQMSWIASFGIGDGSTRNFNFDTKTAYSVECPFKPKRTAIYLEHEKIGFDNGDGSLLGTGTVNSVSYSVNGNVNYAEGNVSVHITPEPPLRAKIEIAFDVDIEKTPTQLPKIVYDTPSRVLYPHCAAFKDVTIQNIWRVCHESSQNLDSLAMQILLNTIAADKDHKHLYDMYRFCPEEGVICKSNSKHSFLTESYETIKALSEVDNKLMMATGVAGLSGIVAGFQACNVFRYLPSTYFEVAQGYRFTSQPHYVGKLFGSIDLYCDPHAPDTWSCLCYAKGRDYGQAAYVAGDAIPSLAFNQSIMEDLERSSIIGELAYHDMQPFDGTRYLCKLTFMTSE